MFKYIVIVFLISNPVINAQLPEFEISGIVVDEVTSKPISNVYIKVNGSGNEFITSADGKFNFTISASGIFIIEFTANGYKPYSKKINTSTDSIQFLLIRMPEFGFRTPLITITDDHPKSKFDDLLELSNVLKDKELQKNLGQTLAATLKNETGISIRSMGPAPSRPVFRGLSGDRVLITEDGVKISDLSSTSPDHAVTMDPFTVEKIEVIRGPKVLLKTPATIGGIINAVRNEIPQQLSNTVKLRLGSFYETTNKGYLLSGVTEIPISNFQFRLEGNYRKAKDMTSPEGVIKNSYINTTTYSGGSSYIFNKGYTGISGRQYKSDYGIPGGFVGSHPNGVDISMNRNQYNFKFNYNFHGNFLDHMDADFSRVNYRHTEYESADLIGAEYKILSYLGYVNLFHNQSWVLNKGIGGISFENRDFNIGGFVFTPPSLSDNISFYINEEFKKTGKFYFEFSGRYNYNFIKPKQAVELSNLDSVYSRVFNTFSLSASAVYELNERINIGVNLSRSSRVPTIEELYSDGPHLAAYSYEIGNPDLKDETGTGSELFAYYSDQNFYGMLTFFYNDMRNYILPRNTGEINFSTLLPVYQTEGIGAKLLGFESQLEYKFLKRFSFDASLSYTYGEIKETKSPLPQIPPLKSFIEFKYTGNNYSVGINSELASSQERVDEFEEPTAGYIIFGAAGQYTFSGRNSIHNFSLNLENITNRIYRNHLSRIKSVLPEPGVGLRLIYKFLF
ncbi:MAG: TonB-dependent receptor [Ignavibacteria bacterium]|nr:TonB-dependent receptor [Ignavibacteria bacterium]